MEDSSMLKIRSDLYPHAKITKTMTSNNESAPSMTQGASSHTPSPIISNMTQLSVPTTTYSVSSPSAPKPVSPSEDKFQEKDTWRSDGEDAQRTPPASKEVQSPRPHLWGATSNAEYSNENPTSPYETTTYSPGRTRSPQKFTDEEYKESESCRVGSSPPHIPAFRRSPTSPAFPHRTFPQGIQGIQGFQGLGYPLSRSIQERVNMSVIKDYPLSLPTSPDKNIISTVPIHHIPGNMTSYRRTPPSDESQHSDEAADETLDLSMSSRTKIAHQPQISQVATSPVVSMSKSPAESPSPFNPFGVFPGFARFHEMNPMFTEGFENAISKSPFNSSLYATNLPPHLLPWLISSQIQNLVQQQQASRSEATRGPSFETSNGGILLEDKDQQPLDLSAKRQETKILPDEDDFVARVLEIKPSTRGRRRADNSKRSYTDLELHAALREIQSGKLGTRKAAVKYGIPRSTLRNKVYKLQLVRDNAKGAAEQKDNLPTILPDSTAALRSPLLTTKVSGTETQDGIHCEALKTIIRKKMTEKLEELSRSNQTYLSGGDQQRLVDAALAHLCDNIPKLALNTDNKTTPSVMLSSLSLYPQLQDFTHKIVEERFYEEIKKINNNSNDHKLSDIPNGYNTDHGTTSINIPTYPSVYKSIPNNVSIRIEDLKSNSSHPSSASPPQANLKDMIAHIINQKIMGDEGQVELSTSTASPPFLPLSVQRMEPSFLKSNLKLPIDEKDLLDQNKKRAKSPSNGGGKGSRPKRGKYRNYDRDNLLKAVQAVQSGEMSVHRAGSFYGVPHSTLEYKVKERHLNRGKNKKDSGNVSNVSMLKSEKENSTLNPVLAASVFSKEYKTDTPDTTTKEYMGNDNRPNDEISIISVHSPPLKKTKTADPEETYSALPISSNPFLSSPFPFWNNASPILAPFLSNPYHTDPLYASHVMSNFQKAASKLNNAESRNSSPSPNRSDAKYSETMSNEGSIKAQGLFSNGGSISSTPPSSPPLQDGLLNTLLRKKMESHLNETTIPWSLSSETQGEDYKERNKCDTDSNIVPPAGLFTLKALLPSFIAARTSLAAAFNQETSNPNVSSLTSSQQVNPVPIMKGSSHIPVMGGGGGIPLSESP